MTELWLGIALLTLIALAFIFYPLLKHRRAAIAQVADTRREDNVAVFRDRLAELQAELNSGSLGDEEFAALKLELEKNLLIDATGETVALQRTAITTRQYLAVLMMALVVPLAGMGLYLKLGSVEQLAVSLAMPKDPFDGRQPTLEEAISQLELELKAKPDNPEGWYILASTFMNQGRYTEALDAYRQVLKLLNESDVQYATVMGQLAQAMFFAAGGVNAEVQAQIDATLKVEPLEITALGLQGIAAFEREEYRRAINFWQQALVNADASNADSFRSGILKARDLLVQQGEDVSDIQLPEVAQIPLRVSVVPDAVAGMDAATPVFVVARPLQGGMPLAAIRLTLADLPIELNLSDANSMSPQAKLSQHEQVSVSVRISRSGNVVPQPGDVIGEISPVNTKGIDKPLELIVKEVVQ